MGKFIAIDGLDGSGKGTQSELLVERLRAEGKRVRVLSFPMYENESSVLVRMYLEGKLGDKPSDTNAYAASMFFGADRYVSYVTDWKKDIDDENTYVVANRYTTANAVHQLSKLPKEQWDSFLAWLWDYEFDKLCLPRPDAVLYLEIPPALSRRMIASRSAQTGRAQDIHEKDATHLDRSYEAALYASAHLGWNQIRCYEGDAMRSRQAIHDEICAILGLAPIVCE
jgi:dTMP kinase